MGIHKFEIDQLIREGNSGGPILNTKYEVVGIAAEGAEKGMGNNAVIAISELFKMLSELK
jgi:S1-C subfamily serine protease